MQTKMKLPHSFFFFLPHCRPHIPNLLKSIKLFGRGNVDINFMHSVQRTLKQLTNFWTWSFSVPADHCPHSATFYTVVYK